MTKQKRPCDCTGYTKLRKIAKFLTGIQSDCYDRWVFFTGESLCGWLDYARETNNYCPENTLPKELVRSSKYLDLQMEKEFGDYRSDICFSGTTHLEAEQFLVARLVCLMEAGVDVWALED